MQWNRTVRQLAADRGLNLGQSARLLAMVHVSTGDAAIACWDAKFAYVSWRPVHAIQRADTDGNPATAADPTWQPLLNANHPEYTSGHACVSTAATTALRAYFDRSDLTVTVRSTTTGTAISEVQKMEGDMIALSAGVTVSATLSATLHSDATR